MEVQGHQPICQPCSFGGLCEPSYRLRIVATRRHDSITLHGHILDNDLRAHMARHAYPSTARADSTRDLEEVVRRPRSRRPSAALIRGNFHAGRASVSVDDLSGEPVLADAALHVDLEVTRHGCAGDIVPGDVNDALRLRGQS